jgi:ribonuclease HI
MGARYIYLDKDEDEKRIDLDLTGYEQATNNQMELRAVVEALKQAPSYKLITAYDAIVVLTDSKYVVDNRYLALDVWPKNHWCNNDGRPIENVELWKAFVKAWKQVRCRVDFQWVKGHSKDLDNKAVDKMAKESANRLLKKAATTIKLRRKKSKLKTKVGSIGMDGQTVSIHIINDQYLRVQKISKYRYEIVSPDSPYFGRVDFAFSYLHHLKSGHSYIVRFNTTTQNPRILEVVSEIVKEEQA